MSVVSQREGFQVKCHNMSVPLNLMYPAGNYNLSLQDVWW